MLSLGYQPSHGSSGAWDVEEELSGKALLPASVSLPEALPSPVHCLQAVASAVGDKGRRELDFTGKINLEFITGIP